MSRRVAPMLVLVALAGCEPEPGGSRAGPGAPDAASAPGADAAGGPNGPIADGGEPDPLRPDRRDAGRGPDAGRVSPDAGRGPDASPGPGVRDAGSGGTADAGRPGADGGAGPGALRLNEVACDRERPWVEVVNPGPDAADPRGWSVADDPLDPARREPLAGDLLAAGDRVQVRQSREGEPLPFAIECGASTLVLLAPDGSVADRVAVPRTVAAHTWGRLPDATGEWTGTAPTRNAPNAAFVPPGGPLFDPQRVVVIDIELGAEGRAALDAAPREWRAVTLRATPEGGPPGEPLQVGLRLKGGEGSFRRIEDKAGFKVKIDHVVEGQRLYGMERLTLNNMVQDPTRIREWTAYTLFRAAGVPAPRVGFAYVRLDGADYGLFANVESYDGLFFDQYFSGTNHLYEAAYVQDLVPEMVDEIEIDMGDPEDRSDLRAVVDLLENPPGGGVFAASDRIDWAVTMPMMAVERYTGHWDGYVSRANNFFVHFDPTGRMSLHPWGTDQTLFEDVGLFSGRSRLFARCEAEPPCRDEYRRVMARVADVHDGLDLEARATALYASLAPWHARDRLHPWNRADSQVFFDRTLAYLRQQRGRVGRELGCEAPGSCAARAE